MLPGACQWLGAGWCRLTRRVTGRVPCRQLQDILRVATTAPSCVECATCPHVYRRLTWADVRQLGDADVRATSPAGGGGVGVGDADGGDCEMEMVPLVESTGSGEGGECGGAGRMGGGGGGMDGDGDGIDGSGNSLVGGVSSLPLSLLVNWSLRALHTKAGHFVPSAAFIICVTTWTGVDTIPVALVATAVSLLCLAMDCLVFPRYGPVRFMMELMFQLPAKLLPRRQESKVKVRSD